MIAVQVSCGELTTSVLTYAPIPIKRITRTIHAEIMWCGWQAVFSWSSRCHAHQACPSDHAHLFPSVLRTHRRFLPPSCWIGPWEACTKMPIPSWECRQVCRSVWENASSWEEFLHQRKDVCAELVLELMAQQQASEIIKLLELICTMNTKNAAQTSSVCSCSVIAKNRWCRSSYLALMPLWTYKSASLVHCDHDWNTFWSPSKSEA